MEINFEINAVTDKSIEIKNNTINSLNKGLISSGTCIIKKGSSNLRCINDSTNRPRDNIQMNS